MEKPDPALRTLSRREWIDVGLYLALTALALAIPLGRLIARVLPWPLVVLFDLWVTVFVGFHAWALAHADNKG